MTYLRPIRLLFLGAPGSGKGTQTSKVLRRFPEIGSLSSGDILRKQISKNTELGAEASNYIMAGKLVPDSIMIQLIEAQMRQMNWLHEDSKWLLDGFPRNRNQAERLDQMLSGKNASLNMVIELDVNQKIILERIEARWVHIPSGRVYNLDYNLPKVPFKDDVTGEPLSKRPDDTAAVFQKRLDVYNKELPFLKEFYMREGILHSVSGDSSDIIYPKIERLILDTFA